MKLIIALAFVLGFSASAMAFPQCSKGEYTSDSSEAKAMIESILRIRNPFARSLLEDIPFKGQRATVNLVDSGGKLQIVAKATFGMSTPAKICQSGNRIVGKSDKTIGMPFTVDISPVDKDTVKVNVSGIVNNTFTAQ